MTRVADLDFTHTVVTFDDPAHPSGLVLGATHPLTDAPAYTAYVRWPDGGLAWLTSIAVWPMDGHPWAVVNRFDVDADDDAVPALSPGSRERRGGGEMRVTDDLEAGRRTLDPEHAPSRPLRVDALARREDAPSTVTPWIVLVEDGRDATAPSKITVLDGVGEVPSGLLLLGDARLASRLRADGSVRTSVDPLGDLPRRMRARVPQRLTLEHTA